MTLRSRLWGGFAGECWKRVKVTGSPGTGAAVAAGEQLLGVGLQRLGRLIYSDRRARHKGLDYQNNSIELGCNRLVRMLNDQDGWYLNTVVKHIHSNFLDGAHLFYSIQLPTIPLHPPKIPTLPYPSMLPVLCATRCPRKYLDSLSPFHHSLKTPSSNPTRDLESSPIHQASSTLFYFVKLPQSTPETVS